MLGIFLDTETNGLNPRKHRVLEIAFQILNIETGACLDKFHSFIALPRPLWELGDPDSLAVNGIAWEECCSGTTVQETERAIVACFQKNGVRRGEAVFICQNPSFDRVFFSQLVDTDRQEELDWPYHWLDLASMYWALRIWQQSHGQAKGSPPWRGGLSKDKIAESLGLGGEPKPHRAENGVVHLIACYRALIGFPGSCST